MKKILSFFYALTICCSTLTATSCGYKDKQSMVFERKVNEMATILFPMIASESTNINLKTLIELVENKKIGNLNPKLENMGYLNSNKSYKDIFEGLMHIGYKEGLDFFYNNYLFNDFIGKNHDDWKKYGLKNINIYSNIQKIFDLLNIVIGAIKANIFNPTTIARTQILLDNLKINNLSKKPIIDSIVRKFILNILELIIDFENVASKWINNVINDIKQNNSNLKITNQCFADYIFIKIFNCIQTQEEDDNSEENIKIKENIITKENYVDIINTKIYDFIDPKKKYSLNINNLSEDNLQKIFASLIIIFSNIPLNNDVNPDNDGDHIFSNDQTNIKFLENFWKENKLNIDNDNDITNFSKSTIKKFNENLKTLFNSLNKDIFLKIYNILFSINFYDDDKDDDKEKRFRNIFKREDILDLDYIHYKKKHEPKPPGQKRNEYFLRHFENNVGFFLTINTFVRKILIDIINKIKTKELELLGNIIAGILVEQNADIKLVEKIQILLSLIGRGVDMTSIKKIITSGQEIELIKLGSLLKLKINTKLGYENNKYFDELFENKKNNLLSSLFNGDLLNKIIDVDPKSLDDFETTIKIFGIIKYETSIDKPKLLKESLPIVANSFRNFFQNNKQWNASTTFSIIFNMFKPNNETKHLNIFNDLNNGYLDSNKKKEMIKKIRNIDELLFNKKYKVIEEKIDENKNDILGFVDGLKNNDKRKELSLFDLVFESLSNKNLKIYDKTDKTKLICEGKYVTLFILGLSTDQLKFEENSIFDNLKFILEYEETKKFINIIDKLLLNYSNNYKKIQNQYLEYINYQNYFVELDKSTIKDYQYKNDMLTFYITYKNPHTNIKSKFEIGIYEIDLKDEPYNLKKTIVKKFKKI